MKRITLIFFVLALALLPIWLIESSANATVSTGSDEARQTMMITDTEPPVVDQFVIANDAHTTNQLIVTLQVTATDSPINGDASGVESIKFLEYEYILGAHRWVAVKQSQWIDYETIGEGYSWTLEPSSGMRYMQAWVTDKARNISLIPGTDVINLLRSNEADYVSENGVGFYRVPLSQGQTFAAWLTPESGDPDLYVWGPNQHLWHSNAYTGTETVTFQAPFTAIYQIEVHGFTSSEYHLTFGATTNEQREANPTGGNDPKPLPEGPAMRLDEWPEYYEPDPLPPIYRLHLPLTIR